MFLLLCVDSPRLLVGGSFRPIHLLAEYSVSTNSDASQAQSSRGQHYRLCFRIVLRRQIETCTLHRIRQVIPGRKIVYNGGIVTQCFLGNPLLYVCHHVRHVPQLKKLSADLLPLRLC